MKSKFKSYLIHFILVAFLTNCASQRVSTLVGGEYNESKNETEYFVFPYGSVSIPGKWTKTDYNSVSKQQFFTNSDSIYIAIAFCRYDQYAFNMDGSSKGLDFVKAYYEWDSQYFMNSHGLQRQEMKIDSVNGFITYRIFGQIEEAEFDTYFLIGNKNGNITNISISDSDKLTQNEKLIFLENLFVSNK